MKKTDIRCENCFWFEPSLEIYPENKDAADGECKRYPPTETHDWWGQPATAPNNRCGEWESDRDYFLAMWPE